MKTNLVSTNLVKAFAALLATGVLMISNPLTSQAGVGRNEKPILSLSATPVTVKYIGHNENSLIFSVSYENPLADQFWLILKDDAGNIIYRQQYNDVRFYREIRIENDGSAIRPTFIIRKGNEESVHKFVVNVATTQEVVVTKG